MKKLFFLFLLLSIISCAKFSLYSEKIEGFPDNRWSTADTKTFSFELTEDAEKAELDLFFSYVFEPGYDKVPIEVIIKKDEEQEDKIASTLLLKDETGKNFADCLGDICDLTQTLTDSYSFSKGKYIITIRQTGSYDYLSNVIALGISLEATE